ncbi:hypothetical protein AJ80_01076 [Polytolypa hystricis UAMH7299]|uniref:Protein kinase domain-containing protein n=1 Tax=Polytolypa hystricis (strain UAMH7299) TaxID=1447883 RepID=A0A2B7Z118_POLH7|nr:hypothetical protein AJ80_01076 [Polytolypa hystricis UAMH7299]
MALDPGSIIALTTIAYQGANLAWDIFRDTLRYDSDSEDLVLQLELERFRFQTWASNAGLAHGTLTAGLLPIYEIVERQIRLIGELFKDADHLRGHYGLSAAQSEAPETDRLRGFIVKMRKSIRASGIKIGNPDADELATSEEPAKQVARVNSRRRIQWGVKDRTRFQKLISTLESHVEKLNQLLTETQQRSTKEDSERINILIVDSVNDEDSLQLVREAVQQKPEYTSIRTLVERKAISDKESLNARSGFAALRPLDLADITLPPRCETETRFIATPRHCPEQYLLFEKKRYESDLTLQDRLVLTSRIHRLVHLLSSTKSADFHTLQAIGYIHDPDNLCWWLVFKLPVTLGVERPPVTAINYPTSLLDLLHSEFRPPLEQRIHLASTIATTLSELYGASWLHKGIRSDNILFHHIHAKQNAKLTSSAFSISSPFIAGFNYSRQDTEARTIEKNRYHTDLSISAYRHPDYQGEAAQGYNIGHDIYSFGLLLAEIAWWTPLSTFLDAEVSKTSRATTTTSPVLVTLSSKMEVFQRPEALELQRRVTSRADRELPFRIGSTYHDVVKWCLSFSTQLRDASIREDWHPALEFYNQAVVPLRKLANGAAD